MKKRTQHNEKTIEQTDYELKSRNKFPPDEKFPVTEQSKQSKKPSKAVKSISDKSGNKNKIEQNPGATGGNKKKRIY